MHFITLPICMGKSILKFESVWSLVYVFRHVVETNKRFVLQAETLISFGKNLDWLIITVSPFLGLSTWMRFNRMYDISFYSIW